MTEKRTWVEIDLDAVAQNVRAVNKMLGGRLMAVVKADAYGHGAVFCAREMAECGVGFFGVSCIDEAMQLREGGVTQDILILGHTEPSINNVRKLIARDISQAVFDLEQTERLDAAAQSAGGRVRAHIKVDTGMNRLGLSWTGANRDPQALRAIRRIARLPNIICEGIFTHFAVSDDPRSSFTGEQFSLYLELVALLGREGISFKLKHAANSAAAINFKETHLDYARCGLILYGLYPAKNMREIGLVPAMQLKTVVSHVHTVKQGESVSYGRVYKAGRDIRAATLPIGYADGFSRLLSNSASVLLGGRQAPVIGRVCMDYCMVDASECGDVRVGDAAVIFGGDSAGGHIAVEQVADMAETINYEIICLIGKRVPRIYYKGGREVGRLNYIAPG